MIEILPIILALLHIFFMFPIALPMGNKVFIYLILKKNPEWIATHPEFKTYHIFENAMRYFLYAVAGVNLIAFINYTIINPNPDMYFMLAIMPLQIVAASFLVFWTLLYFYVSKRIPAPEKTTASLENRNLSSFVSPWVAYPGFVATAVLGVYYIWAFYEGLIDQNLLSRRLTEVISSLIITGGFLIWFIKRKISETEVIFGEGTRKYEIWLVVGLTYYMFIFRLDRFAFDFLGGMLFSDAVVVPIIGLTLQAWMLFMTIQPKSKKILKQYEVLTKNAM